MKLDIRFTIAAGVIAFSTSTLQAQERVTVRDSWTPSGLQAGWHWGLDKGIFKRAGLDVVHEDGNGSTTTVQLIGSGQFDVGYADLSVMAVARGKSVPITSIGGLINKTSLGVFVSKGSGIKSPKDLEGKEVIYTASSFEGPFIDPFLQAGGTDRQKVNMVSVDGSAKISTYVAGRGAAMITSIPFGMPYVAKGRPSDFITFADFGFVLPSYGLVVREETLKSKKPTLQKLSKAFFESWQAIIDGGEPAIQEAAEIMIKRLPGIKLDRDQTMASIREHMKYFRTPNTAGKPLGYQSEDDWKAVIKSLETARLIPTGTKPDRYFTNELLMAPQ